jgi:hypothetical protein
MAQPVYVNLVGLGLTRVAIVLRPIRIPDDED